MYFTFVNVVPEIAYSEAEYNSTLLALRIASFPHLSIIILVKVLKKGTDQTFSIPCKSSLGEQS